MRTLLVAVALAASALATAAPARAGTDTFCNNALVGANGGKCPGNASTNHSLTSSKGTNNYGGLGCGGSTDTSTQFYCATPSGCHNFNGSTIRYPLAMNVTGSTVRMTGVSTWGSTSAPSGCGTGGSYYSVTGPTSSTAPPALVPALDRDSARAPDEVAELFESPDQAHAVPFETPDGNGWILLSPGRRQVCVALQDPTDGWGYSCQGYGQAETKGSLVTMQDGDTGTASGDVAVAILAEGSEGLSVTTRAGETRVLPGEDGLVVTELRAGDLSLALDAGDAGGRGSTKQLVARR